MYTFFQENEYEYVSNFNCYILRIKPMITYHLLMYMSKITLQIDYKITLNLCPILFHLTVAKI